MFGLNTVMANARHIWNDTRRQQLLLKRMSKRLERQQCRQSVGQHFKWTKSVKTSVRHVKIKWRERRSDVMWSMCQLCPSRSVSDDWLVRPITHDGARLCVNDPRAMSTKWGYPFLFFVENISIVIPLCNAYGQTEQVIAVQEDTLTSNSKAKAIARGEHRSVRWGFRTTGICFQLPGVILSKKGRILCYRSCLSSPPPIIPFSTNH